MYNLRWGREDPHTQTGEAAAERIGEARQRRDEREETREKREEKRREKREENNNGNNVLIKLYSYGRYFRSQ